MVKHGNRAASSACGAADVLEALGVVIDLPPPATERLARETGIAFLLRAAVPPGAPVRRGSRAASSACRRSSTSSGRWRTRPGRRAGGRRGRSAAGPDPGRRAGRRGCSALVFRGDDGLDELTVAARSTVWMVHGGTVSQTSFDPATSASAGRRPVTCAAATRRTTRRLPAPAGRPAGPGAGHRTAERGRRAGRRSWSSRSRGTAGSARGRLLPGLRPPSTRARPPRCSAAGRKPASGWPGQPADPASRAAARRAQVLSAYPSANAASRSWRE